MDGLEFLKSRLGPSFQDRVNQILLKRPNSPGMAGMQHTQVRTPLIGLAPFIGRPKTNPVVPTMPNQPMGPAMFNPSNLRYNKNQPYAYKEGGMVGPGGQRMPLGKPGLSGGQGQGQQIAPEEINQQVQQMVQQNPEAVAQVKQAIMQAIQSGELTMQELSTAVKLARIAASNPQMYPQLKQFAEAQDIVQPGELPEQYDQGLIITLLIAGEAVQSQQGGDMSQGAEGQTAQVPPGTPSMKNGGAVPQSKNLDGSVHIKAHEGEVVVPAHVVRAKGTDFFRKMVESYDKDGNPVTK